MPISRWKSCGKCSQEHFSYSSDLVFSVPRNLKDITTQVMRISCIVMWGNTTHQWKVTHYWDTQRGQSSPTLHGMKEPDTPKTEYFVRWREKYSVVSSSLWPHGLYAPWNSPVQNTGMLAFSFSNFMTPL